MSDWRNDNAERGAAMVLVITILAALLGVGAIALSLQLNSTKQAALVKENRTALYCAEAGLAQARTILTANQPAWNDILNYEVSGATGASPAAFYPVVGDIDGDGVNDYSVRIRDDGDDTDLATDSNTTIVLISSCTKYLPNTPATVLEVITQNGQGYAYRNQSGQGAGNTGNAN